jgi:hypothetical protein
MRGKDESHETYAMVDQVDDVFTCLRLIVCSIGFVIACRV